MTERSDIQPTSWNFGDVWEEVASRHPANAAIIHDGHVRTWGEFARRANSIGATLAEQLEPQQSVAIMARNGPEYLETMYACFLSATIPVNTNYRYAAPELTYLWDNADVRAVVFAEEFSSECDAVRQRMPEIQMWLHIGSADRCPVWAIPFEEAASADDRLTGRERSGDDLILQYTGGTTGKPKGVMWRQDDLFRMLEQANGADLTNVTSPGEYVDQIGRPSVRVLPAAPLMHGTALWFSLPPLSRGGTVITLPDRHYDAARLLDALDRHAVKSVAVVGDVFVKPMLAALDTEADRWDLSSLRVIFSSGVMFSRDSKQRLLAHAPHARVIDNLGSQESGAAGLSTSSPDAVNDTSIFEPGAGTRVIDDAGQDVTPGSGAAGRIALTGYLPLGYHKDPQKTAETFIDIDGQRYVVPGDWAEVLEDGKIRLIGRGSQCINTGGEKVFPEEVEEILKSIPGVADAAVVGIPDDRFGERVVALATADRGAPTTADVLHAARAELAGYKLPKEIVWLPDLGRGPNGKLDYPQLRRTAIARTHATDAP